jgi:hypothetical protein
VSQSEAAIDATHFFRCLHHSRLTARKLTRARPLPQTHSGTDLDGTAKEAAKALTTELLGPKARKHIDTDLNVRRCCQWTTVRFERLLTCRAQLAARADDLGQ